jgi:hypothetical protein
MLGIGFTLVTVAYIPSFLDTVSAGALKIPSSSRMIDLTARMNGVGVLAILASLTMLAFGGSRYLERRRDIVAGRSVWSIGSQDTHRSMSSSNDGGLEDES